MANWPKDTDLKRLLTLNHFFSLSVNNFFLPLKRIFVTSSGFFHLLLQPCLDRLVEEVQTLCRILYAWD